MAATPSRFDRVLPTAAPVRRWAWRAAAVAAGATVIFAAGAWADGAASAPRGGSAAASAGEYCPHAGGPWGGHDPRGRGEMPSPMGGLGMGLPNGPRLDRMLDEVKVSDEQRKQIHAIADKAGVDLQALREEGRKLHEQGMALWGAPKLDDKAIEAHRQQMLSLHDRGSRRVMQAMLDAAKVLRPEQRAELVRHAQEHQGRFERMKAHLKERMGWSDRPAPGASAPALAASR